jgi:peptidoglycan hydrolase CwlO-like protein
MMKHEPITLSQALKKKTRLAGEIKRLEKVIGENNSHPQETPVRLDLSASMEELKCKHRELAEIKSRIACGNAGMKSTDKGVYPQIHLMAELKGLVKFIRCLKTTEGKVNENSYGDPNVVEYVAEIPMDKVLELDKSFQQEIEKLQDEIDYYNVTTKITA